MYVRLSISSSSFPVGQGSLRRFWKLPREPAKRRGLWNCCEPAHVLLQMWRARRSGDRARPERSGKRGPSDKVASGTHEPRKAALGPCVRRLGFYTQTNGPSGSGLTGSRSQNHLDRKMGLRVSMIPSSLGQDQRLSDITLRIREVAH